MTNEQQQRSRIADTAYDPRATAFLRTVAGIYGVVFLLVGILGCIPGITTNHDAMNFAGHDSHAMLFGIFAVSILHNIVHLAFGIAGLALARTPAAARNYLIAGGIIYLLLWIYGLLINHNSNANFVPVNNADNWLHLALAIGMIGLGVALANKATHPARNH